MPAAVSTTSVPTTSRPSASPAEPPSPLAPLHGTQVPLPTSDDGEIAIFPRTTEPLLCIDDPALGEVCILG